MNTFPHLTYLAQVRRTRRICAFLQYPKHPRLALITRRYSPIKKTDGAMELLKVVVIHGLAQDVVKSALRLNTGVYWKEFGRWRRGIRFGSSRLHVVVKKLQEKRLMMD